MVQLQSFPTWEEAVPVSYKTFMAGTGVTDNLISSELLWPEQYLSHPAMRDTPSDHDRVMAAWDEWLVRHPEHRLDEGDIPRSERPAIAIAHHVPNPRPFSKADREAEPGWYDQLYRFVYRPLFKRIEEQLRQEQAARQTTDEKTEPIE